MTAQYAEWQTPPWTRSICYIALTRYRPTDAQEHHQTSGMPEQWRDNFCTICHTPPPTIYLHDIHKITLHLPSLWLICLVFIYCWFIATVAYVIILQSVIVSQEIMYCGQTFGIQTKLRIHTVGFENVVVFIIVLCGMLYLKVSFIFIHIILFCLTLFWMLFSHICLCMPLIFTYPYFHHEFIFYRIYVSKPLELWMFYSL